MRASFDWQRQLQKVNCFFPVYGEDGGNYTCIRLVGGEEILYRKTTGSVLREVCRHFGVDPQAMRRKYGAQVRRDFSTPIPVCAGLTLIPVRTRTGVDKGQGTMGYAVRARVKDCLPPPAGVQGARGLIIFEDGSELATLHSVKTLANLCRVAREVEEAYLAQQVGVAGVGVPRLVEGLFCGQEPEEIYVVAKYRAVAKPGFALRNHEA